MNIPALQTSALAFLALAACGSEKEASAKPNVILICLDTVRADHLGSYGYEERATSPFLDSLASSSLRFSKASATACWTKPSVPTILTGLLPMQHGVYRGSAQDEAGSFTDVLPEEALTLAEVFLEHGYQTAAFVKNSQLRRGIGFEQGFGLYRDQAGDAREIRWRASDWLDQRDVERPFFLYLHLLDAHWPYAVPDEYASKWADPIQVKRIRAGDWRALRDAVNRGERTLSEAEMTALIALYDGSIRYMDDQLALLWSKLQHDGLAQTTVICVISDHGEEFLEHGKLGHGHGLYENLLSVPWILHRPGQKALQNDTRVSLLDLYPTLLAAAGISTSLWNLPGINRLQGPEVIRPALAEHLDPGRYQLAWIENQQKIIDSVTPEIQSAAIERSLLDLQLRGRWEVRFTSAEREGLLATRMRPSKPQDAQLTELELKGQATQVSAGSFYIAGIEVNTSFNPEFYGHGDSKQPAGEQISPGQMLKARGNLIDGSLVARKIKRYGPDSEIETEIRGPIDVIDEHEVRIGGISLAVDKDTLIEFRTARVDLGVKQVNALLLGELAWQERSITGYALDADTRELSPMELKEGALDQGSKLEQLRRFLETSVWRDERGQELTDDLRDDLKAIGY